MITVPEAARRAGVAAETVRRWIRAGRLASTKVGTQHLVDEGDVDALAGRTRRASEPPPPYAAREAFPRSDLSRLTGRIVTDSRVAVGKPTVRGTRIPVQLILEFLSGGWSIADVLDNYPRLTDDDVRACLAYAAACVEDEAVLPITAR